MFTKLATKIDSQEMWLPVVFGGHPKYFRPPYIPKSLFGENLQLNSMESVSAFLTTDKAIVTKLTRLSKKLNYTKIWNFGTKEA